MEARQVVEEPLLLLAPLARERHPRAQFARRLVGAAHLAQAERDHAHRVHAPHRAALGEGELAEGLLHEAHLLVGDPEVVVRLEILLAELILHVALELLEDVGEPLPRLLRRRRGLRGHRRLELRCAVRRGSREVPPASSAGGKVAGAAASVGAAGAAAG